MSEFTRRTEESQFDDDYWGLDDLQSVKELTTSNELSSTAMDLEEHVDGMKNTGVNLNASSNINNDDLNNSMMASNEEIEGNSMNNRNRGIQQPENSSNGTLKNFVFLKI